MHVYTTLHARHCIHDTACMCKELYGGVWWHVMCIAACCSALQCVAVCCSVLQCVTVCCSVLQCVTVWCSVVQCVTVWCSVLQCGAVCYSVVQCVAVWCSVLQCGTVCCSALKYAVRQRIWTLANFHVNSKWYIERQEAWNMCTRAATHTATPATHTATHCNTQCNTQMWAFLICIAVALDVCTWHIPRIIRKSRHFPWGCQMPLVSCRHLETKIPPYKYK